MSDLKKYLKSVCRHIKNKSLRHSIYKELRCHYLLKIEFLMSNESLSKTEAIRKILDEAETSRKLGKRLHFANTTWYLRRPLLLASFCASFLSIFILIASTSYVVHKKLLPVLSESFSVSEEVLALIEKDMQELSLKPIFKESKRESNAHLFLNAKFKDSGENETSKNRVRSFLSKYGALKMTEKQFFEAIDDPELFEIDTTWAGEVYSYDHWNIYDDELLKGNLKLVEGKDSIKKIEFVASYNVPNFHDFFSWSLVYALQKAKQGDSNKGARFLRHAISLINSSRTLIGQSMTAIALKTENRFIKYNKLKQEAVSDERSQTYKRVSWAWAGIVHSISQNPKNLSKWEKYMKPELGFCAGVAESPMGLSYLETFYHKPWPFEMNLEDRVEASRRFQRSVLKACDFNELLPILTPQQGSLPWWDKNRQKYAMIFHSESRFLKFVPNLFAIPYLRQIYAYLIMTVGTPNYTGLYRNLLEK